MLSGQVKVAQCRGAIYGRPRRVGQARRGVAEAESIAVAVMVYGSDTSRRKKMLLTSGPGLRWAGLLVGPQGKKRSRPRRSGEKQECERACAWVRPSSWPNRPNREGERFLFFFFFSNFPDQF